MGTEAENLDQNTSEENEFEEVEAEEIESEETDENEAEGDGQGEDDTQPQDKQQAKTDWIQKRVARANRKVEKVSEEAEAAKNELELLRQKNKLLELAVQQRTQQPKPDAAPNPDDFDGGEYDPEYKKAHESYLIKKAEEAAHQRYQESQNNTLQQQQEAAKRQELEQKQRGHYERALTLEVKDYDVAEDKVMEILGEDNVNHIIANFEEDSHALVYHLGKNEKEARRLADLIQTNPIRGAAEIGRLSESLKLKPSKSFSPSPVDPLEGAEPGVNATEAKIGAAFKQYEKGAITMQQYLDRKKQILGASK